jgi:hypothetical protein
VRGILGVTVRESRDGFKDSARPRADILTLDPFLKKSAIYNTLPIFTGFLKHLRYFQEYLDIERISIDNKGFGLYIALYINL